MPRAADGVGTACESLSTFVVGEVKHAKSPQTVTEISMIFHHLHVLLSAKSAERIALSLHFFNSQLTARSRTKQSVKQCCQCRYNVLRLNRQRQIWYIRIFFTTYSHHFSTASPYPYDNPPSCEAPNSRMAACSHSAFPQNTAAPHNS